MAVTIERSLGEGAPTYHGTGTERRIVEKYFVVGDDISDNAQNPSLVSLMAGLPVRLDPHPDIAACLVVTRDIINQGPKSSIATITYSDNPMNALVVDGPSVVTYDLSGRSETQPWGLDKIVTDRDNAAIGANNEGASVYRPFLAITYEHLESIVDPDIYPLTGTINNAVYKGWAKNSLVFLGAVARSEGSNWRLTYSFLYSIVGHIVTWRNYEDREIVQPDGEKAVKRFYSLTEQTARVYNESDFSLLPI